MRGTTSRVTGFESTSNNLKAAIKAILTIEGSFPRNLMVGNCSQCIDITDVTKLNASCFIRDIFYQTGILPKTIKVMKEQLGKDGVANVLCLDYDFLKFIFFNEGKVHCSYPNVPVGGTVSKFLGANNGLNSTFFTDYGKNAAYIYDKMPWYRLLILS